MHNGQPRVYIGLPVFNGENYLSGALDSILAQTYKDFKLIIVDNASTDKTQEICLRYAANDPRIRYHRNEINLGLTRNFNRTFELATGEYFAYLAHDDYISPNFIAKCVEVLDSDPSILLCHSQVLIVDKHSKPVACYDDKLKLPNEGSSSPHKRFKDLVMINHFCIDCYGLMRRDVLLEIRPLFESHYGADRNLLAELSLIGKFYHIPEVLFFWRDEQEKYWKFNSWLHRLRSWQVWAKRLDTSKPNKVPIPRWNLLWGYLRAVSRVSLSAKERILCYVVVAEWIPKNIRGLCKDLLVAGLILVWQAVTSLISRLQLFY